MSRCMVIVLVVSLLLIPALGCDEDPTTVQNRRYSVVSDSSFAVGDASTLTVDNFVGVIDVRPGPPGAIRVVATRTADRIEDLGQIQVEMTEVSNGVEVVTDNPSNLENVSVDLTITVPPDTRPVIHNGVGSTSYDGRCEGECQFDTGVGGITLRLPADVNVTVELTVGVGAVHLGLPVVGVVSQRIVNGTIGTGKDGTVYAHVGVGDIKLIAR